MAVGDATSRLGRIDPSSLIGTPDTSIVEPRAVALLTDAFRQGVVSADDVMARVGKLGQTRKKAELMQLEEATSPEAQALRQQQVAAGTAQAQQAEAAALRAQVLDKFPNVANFDKFAASEGIKQPTLSDGSPDFEKMDEIGAELAVFNKRKERARAEMENIVPHFDAEARVVSAFTKQGQPVDPKRVPELTAIINSPFAPGQAPGTFQAPAAPAATAPQVTPQVTPLAPAEGVSRSGFATPASAVVEARPAVGAPVAGGFAMAPLPAEPASEKDATERTMKIAAMQSLLPAIAEAKDIIKEEGRVGPLHGSPPGRLFNRVASALTGARSDEFEDQRRLEILISNKILEGAQVLKGNLSDKDVRFLRESVPSPSDLPPVWEDFLNTWEKAIQTNTAIIEGRMPKPSGDLFAPPGWESGRRGTGADRPAGQNPIVTLPSGKRVQRDAQGNFQVVQ